MKLLLVALMASAATASIAPRIVNGDQATPGEFPWMAGIYYTTPERTSFCGGALISDQWVLTAAHCSLDVTQFTVYLGSNSLVAFDPNRVIIQTDKYVIHPNYTTGNFMYDVALIDLQRTVEFNDFLQPIALYPLFLITLTRPVIVAGWGKTSDEANTISEELNYVALSTISNTECNEFYGDEVTGYIICAMGVGKNICAGDSGGPLIYFSLDGSPKVVGVASFVSSAGCSSAYPSGYVRTSFHLDWIREITGIQA